MTVKDLRLLLDQLPEQARILPDWFSRPPNDGEPWVRIADVAIRTDTFGPYLSVLVDLVYFQDEEDTTDEAE